MLGGSPSVGASLLAGAGYTATQEGVSRLLGGIGKPSLAKTLASMAAGVYAGSKILQSRAKAHAEKRFAERYRNYQANLARGMQTKRAAAQSYLTPDSSNVRGYNYDAKTRSLVVTYNSGGTYQYSDVPKNVYRSLRRNKSAGKTIHKRVKQGGYKYEKLAGGNLFDNIRKKRARGDKPAKPGEKGYPKQKTWEKVTKEAALALRKEHRNPKGGLTAKGRSAYNKATGSNLKPGVRGKADTPEKMRRKGSFLSRMFGPGNSGPMRKPNGEPTRRALSAAAWGEPVPKDDAGRARLYAKGQALLQRYKGMEKKAQGEGSRTPGFDTVGGSVVPDSAGESFVDRKASRSLWGADSPRIKCKSCSWSWRMTDSEPSDVTNCHKCGGQKTGAMIKKSHVDLSRRLMKLAGQAKKQVTWQGLTIKLEYEKGDERSGVNKATGKKWSRTMHDGYGYMPGTYGKGADGDAIDVYLNPDAGEAPPKSVFRVRQKRKTGEYDEDKFMVGYESAAAAKKAFLRNMPSWAFGSMTSMPMTSFKRLVGQGKAA